MAAAGPLALVTSCARGFAAQELVKRITGKDDLTVGATTSGGVNFYPWTIDNKYYSADIHLCVVPSAFLVTGEIAESVQAFVVYFDSSIKCGLDSVSEWLPLTEEWLPEVMILVCDRVSENGVNRQKAQEWCIKHGFELVELSPEELPDEDDDFPESTGIKRIVQALNANVWSNVVMKTGFNTLSALQEGLSSQQKSHLSKWKLQNFLEIAQKPDNPVSCRLRLRVCGGGDGDCHFSVQDELKSQIGKRTQGFGLLSTLAGANSSIGSEENQDTEPNPSAADREESHLDNREDAASTNSLQIDNHVDPVLDMDIQELANLTTREGDLENFERLFSKLKEMKEKAATLPHEQRKLHAEKVAKAFWMAIGGDRDEIEGLSSDEEN